MPEDYNTYSDPGIEFQLPHREKTIIKVIGVGGGGGNAVSYMYDKGIHDVSFVLCNTDRMVLDGSNVPVRIQLGNDGLGAGGNPEKGKAEAEKSIEQINKMLDNDTKMVFVTAGMGGGTGTGAGPLIAGIAKKKGILTVGIVTIPFQFEGRKKMLLALEGVKEMSENVDSLLVINNQRLLDIYGDLDLEEAYAKANDILTTAAKSIAEIITIRGQMNVDFEDVKTVLKDGGIAIMSSGFAKGEGRVKRAIENALNSPLLCQDNVFDSKRILINITTPDKPEHKIKTSEMNEFTNFMDRFSTDYEAKWGTCIDPQLDEELKITILATGFGLEEVASMEELNAAERHEQQMKIEQENKILELYYGKGEKKDLTDPKVHIFRPEDMDNEELINKVSDSPTFSRSQKKLKSFTDTESKNDEKNAAEEKPASTEPETIVFEM